MTVNLTLQLTFIHSFRIQLEVKVSTREDLRALEESETRILLLYATRPEGENIMRWAKEAGLTSKSYIWVATQSVIGESRDASPDLPAGMLGKCMKESTLMCQIKNEKQPCINLAISFECLRGFRMYQWKLLFYNPPLDTIVESYYSNLIKKSVHTKSVYVSCRRSTFI